jgi:hypothetical protein
MRLRSLIMSQMMKYKLLRFSGCDETAAKKSTMKKIFLS